jgi:acyl-homoserine lactone acylase PvdQ
MNGNVNTVNHACWDFNEPFKVKSGAVARFISDLNEDEVYTIIPGGSSGDALNVNYSNQFQLYLSGGYIKLYTNKKPHSSFKHSVTLRPVRTK